MILRFLAAVLGLLLALYCSAALANGPASRFQIKIPTAEQEAAYLWQNLNATAFFEKNGYSVSYPDGAFFQTLIAKARGNALTPADNQALVRHMQRNIYRRSDYQTAHRQIVGVLNQLTAMLEQLEATRYRWGFASHARYSITLTLYGPGGSYDPETGSIRIFATADGRFKQYQNPLNTLIHEVVHMGIEASIVERLGVPHGLKERIVDNLVLRHFGHQLMDYSVQPMGDATIDDALSTLEALHQLPDHVQAVLDRSPKAARAAKTRSISTNRRC